jgi:hypothetical protein
MLLLAFILLFLSRSEVRIPELDQSQKLQSRNGLSSCFITMLVERIYYVHT